MKKLQLAAFTLVGLFAGILLKTPTCEAAFGASPPWIRNDHLLLGETYEETINLSRNETEQAVKVTVRKEGDQDLLKWITIQDEANLVMEKGQTALPMKVTIEVPKNAEIKNYRADLYIKLIALPDPELGGGGVGIGLGAHISVEVAVVKKPSLPGATQTTTPEAVEAPIAEVPAVKEPVVEESAVEESTTSVPASDIKPAAPVCPETENTCSTSNLVKLISAMAVLVGAVAGLLYVLNKRRQTKPSDGPAASPTITSPPSPAP